MLKEHPACLDIRLRLSLNAAAEVGAGRGQCSKWCGEFIIGANVNVCIDAEHLRPAKKRPVLYLRAATPLWLRAVHHPLQSGYGARTTVRVATLPMERMLSRGPRDNFS